jgi:hypothetical protein
MDVGITILLIYVVGFVLGVCVLVFGMPWVYYMIHGNLYTKYLDWIESVCNKKD